MSQIKDNYLIPIYCPDHQGDEKNFHATGQDIVDTVHVADLYVKKTGDQMTGALEFKKDDDTHQLRIRPNSTVDDYTTNIISCNGGTLRLRTATDEGLVQDNWLSHIILEVTNHTVGSTDLAHRTSINALRTPSNPDHAANKQYVDDTATTTKEELEQEIDTLNDRIIELEEEIEAIAKAIIRGRWNVNTNDLVPAVGEYVMLDTNGENTDDFREAVKVLFATVDSEGTDHTFHDVTVDEYLQILNDENDSYGLYTIDSISDQTGALVPYYEFGVDFDQSYGDHLASGVARIKLFTPPVMDGDVYVLRAGDVIEGTLQIGSTNNHKGHLKIMAEHSASTTLFDVKADNNTDGGGYAAYNGRIEDNNHIITKEYYHANLQSAPGPKGDAATIHVGTTRTVEYPNNAAVSNGGNENDAVFNFDIPRGQRGPKGDKGTEGILHDGPNPPEGQPKGSLLLTNTNKFYLYY